MSKLRVLKGATWIRAEYGSISSRPEPASWFVSAPIGTGTLTLKSLQESFEAARRVEISRLYAHRGEAR